MKIFISRFCFVKGFRSQVNIECRRKVFGREQTKLLTSPHSFQCCGYSRKPPSSHAPALPACAAPGMWMSALRASPRRGADDRVCCNIFLGLWSVGKEGNSNGVSRIAVAIKILDSVEIFQNCFTSSFLSDSLPT